MATTGNQCETVRDGFAGELTEAALRVAARHGVNGFSVDQEIGLWRRFGDVLRRHKGSRAADGNLPETLSAELAETAYEMSLDKGFCDSFVDVRLDFWRTLRQATREGAWAREFWSFLCGEAGTTRGQRQLVSGAA